MPTAITHNDYSRLSANNFAHFTCRAMVALLILLVSPPNGFATPVRGISTPATTPIVPMTSDGGVLMLPLAAAQPGDSWPRTLPVTLESGREITGHVAWIAPSRQDDHARWTDSPLGLTVRAIEPNDRTMTERPDQHTAADAGAVHSRAGRPFLVAELPPGVDGSLRLLDQTVHPRWFSASEPDQDARDRGPLPTGKAASDMLQREQAYDRPDPEHPLEYWRWVLLADRLGKQPPPNDGDDLTRRLTALYTAQLWQIALDRVRSHSRGVADHLRDLLTRVGSDGDVSFAAWIADPAAVNALLNLLLDEQISGDELIDRALEWADEHERPMAWLESATDQYARVAIVNPSFRPKVARLRWDDPDEIPIGVELPAGQLTRVRIERATEASAGDHTPGSFYADAGLPEVLLIDVDERTITLVLDVPVRQVGPPGVYLPPFSPPLTLASVQQGSPPVLSERYATAAQVRRVRGRWELFIECRRPPSAESRGGKNNRERVRVFIGETDRFGQARILLTVPEHGEPQLVRGAEHTALRIHRRSIDDRWLCRVVLPDTWLEIAPDKATSIGVARSFADADAVATTPMPAVPWRPEPGRLSFDLTQWDDVPRE